MAFWGGRDSVCVFVRMCVCVSGAKGRPCLVGCSEKQIGEALAIIAHLSSPHQPPTQQQHQTNTGDGVLLGAGATILGNVNVGSGSLVGACSLVLEDVGPHSVAVGVPAKVVGQTTDNSNPPAQSMRQADAIVMVEEDMPDFII